MNTEMHARNLDPWRHAHEFAVVDSRSERRTALVAGLTATTMVVEIAAGFAFGSMALLADGWHMGTHVAALAISVYAYRYAKRHAEDPRFTFGTGKVGVLGGFTSAVALAVVAFLIAIESVQRFFVRPSIQFDHAIFVAIIGFLVNVVSALILRRLPFYNHGVEVGHPSSHDHNLRAAYLHVLADALTSVFAIAALLLGKMFGYVWLDPVTGLLGSLLIARWSYALIRDTGHILIDAAVNQALIISVRSAIESDSDNKVSDLHVWKVGPNDYAAIVSVVTAEPRRAEHYKSLLKCVESLSHVTVEVHGCPPQEVVAPT